MSAPNPLTDEQLAANFADIAPPLTNDAALLEANKCLYCHDAPCTIACPTHIDVPAFIKKIATGNLRGSARVILDANPFGHSCARACPVEVLCEGACVLNDRDEQPIKIALLQRHATDYVLDNKLRLFQAGPSTGKRVAVVGAGPAGLACARDLRRHGHEIGRGSRNTSSRPTSRSPRCTTFSTWASSSRPASPSHRSSHCLPSTTPCLWGSGSATPGRSASPARTSPAWSTPSRSSRTSRRIPIATRRSGGRSS